MYVSLVDLCTVLPPKRAELLCRHFGGTSFYMPKNPREGSPLASVLGEPELAALCKAFGGQDITLPNGNFMPKKTEIISRLEQGQSHNSIASDLQVTDRWVRYVAANYVRPVAVQCSLPL